jgi:hypothetical protein
MVPVFTGDRSTGLASSFAPAASPATPQAFTVTSPPARQASYGVGHPYRMAVLLPGPYPPDLSRCHAYGALPLIPLRIPSSPARRTRPVWHIKPSWLCQRCFPPSPASPGSDCAQLLPGCCDSPARRSCTSFDLQRLTAHQRLVAHHQDLRIHGDVASHEERQPAEQPDHQQIQEA